MKNENQKLDLTRFEVLSEEKNGTLIGGFSMTASGEEAEFFAADTNNCHGGNCVKGCGKNLN